MPQVQTHSGFRKIATMACHVLGFPCGSDGKESACNARDPGLISGSGRSPGEENDNLLQYSCLENSIDRGAWWATVHGVAKSWIPLNNYTFTFMACHKTSIVNSGPRSIFLWCKILALEYNRAMLKSKFPHLLVTYIKSAVKKENPVRKWA